MAVARKAFAGIAKNVTDDGVVKGTCQGTNIGQDVPDIHNPLGEGKTLEAVSQRLKSFRCTSVRTAVFRSPLIDVAGGVIKGVDVTREARVALSPVEVPSVDCSIEMI